MSIKGRSEDFRWVTLRNPKVSFEAIRRASLGALAILVVMLATVSWAEEPEASSSEESASVSVYYLEIVTPDVEGACELYGSFYGVTFGDPIPAFGGARTAPLAGGGLMGIRGPLRPDEKPVTRPYFLVDDLDAAIVKATDSGALLAVPALPIEGHGRFAVLIQNGIEWGLWES